MHACCQRSATIYAARLLALSPPAGSFSPYTQLHRDASAHVLGNVMRHAGPHTLFMKMRSMRQSISACPSPRHSDCATTAASAAVAGENIRWLRFSLPLSRLAYMHPFSRSQSTAHLAHSLTRSHSHVDSLNSNQEDYDEALAMMTDLMARFLCVYEWSPSGFAAGLAIARHRDKALTRQRVEHEIVPTFPKLPPPR
jgi:hypothetical protein